MCKYMQLKLKKDNSIKRKNYVTNELINSYHTEKDHIKKEEIKQQIDSLNSEYIFDKKTELIPKKINKLICILLTEDKGAVFLARKINTKKNYFRYRHNKYIFDNKSIHLTKNGSRICLYLEGISTPLSVSNIEKYVEEIEWVDLDGSIHKEDIVKIKGLKYDSNILDTFSDEHFADDFTKTKIDNFQLYILILVIISLIVSSIGIVISYIYH